MTEIRVCRACARLIFEKEIAKFDKFDLQRILKECIPELIFNISDPVLCFKCFSLLYLFREFKQTCLRTEDRIRDYVLTHPDESFVTLRHIFEEKVKVEKSPPPSSEAEAVSVTVKKEVVDEVVVEVKKEMIDDDDDEGGVGGSKNFGLQVGDGSSLDQSDEEFDSLTVAKYVPKKQTSSTAYSPCGFCGEFVSLDKYVGHVNACGAICGYVVVVNTTNLPPGTKKIIDESPILRNLLQHKN